MSVFYVYIVVFDSFCVFPIPFNLYENVHFRRRKIRYSSYSFLFGIILIFCSNSKTQWTSIISVILSKVKYFCLIRLKILIFFCRSIIYFKEEFSTVDRMLFWYRNERITQLPFPFASKIPVRVGCDSYGIKSYYWYSRSTYLLIIYTFLK